MHIFDPFWSQSPRYAELWWSKNALFRPPFGANPLGMLSFGGLKMHFFRPPFGANALGMLSFGGLKNAFSTPSWSQSPRYAELWWSKTCIFRPPPGANPLGMLGRHLSGISPAPLQPHACMCMPACACLHAKLCTAHARSSMRANAQKPS